MADAPRTTCTNDAVSAVVSSARCLLPELPDEHFLSVQMAWELMGDGPWSAPQCAEATMRLVISLPRAHDDSPGVLWHTPRGDEKSITRAAPHAQAVMAKREETLAATIGEVTRAAVSTATEAPTGVQEQKVAQAAVKPVVEACTAAQVEEADR